MAKNIKYILIIYLFIVTTGCSSKYFVQDDTYSNNPIYRAEYAEKLVNDSKFDQAIEEYKKHIDILRDLKRQNKASEEEIAIAYYYYKISEIYLKLNNIDEAIAYNKIAEDLKLDKIFVINQYVKIANYLELHDRRYEAIELLKSKLDLDIDLFNYEIDRIYKDQIELENQSISTKSQ